MYEYFNLFTDYNIMGLPTFGEEKHVLLFMYTVSLILCLLVVLFKHKVYKVKDFWTENEDNPRRVDNYLDFSTETDQDVEPVDQDQMAAKN